MFEKYYRTVAGRIPEKLSKEDWLVLRQADLDFATKYFHALEHNCLQEWVGYQVKHFGATVSNQEICLSPRELIVDLEVPFSSPDDEVCRALIAFMKEECKQGRKFSYVLAESYAPKNENLSYVLMVQFPQNLTKPFASSLAYHIRRHDFGFKVSKNLRTNKCQVTFECFTYDLEFQQKLTFKDVENLPTCNVAKTTILKNTIHGTHVESFYNIVDHSKVFSLCGVAKELAEQLGYTHCYLSGREFKQFVEVLKIWRKPLFVRGTDNPPYFYVRGKYFESSSESWYAFLKDTVFNGQVQSWMLSENRIIE